jgi:uncharacterized protein YyaL (SSP411 family)
MYSQLMLEDVFTTLSGSESGHANLLGHAASSYLRSACHQPVHWHPWGKAAFVRARAEKKPILLDIGAVWCHWCHVMDRESYEDPEIARLINELFVAVKVDRDERPDVDARYQAAVSAITGQSGWPLTVFLTPDGRPYFGGTYIPREDRPGQAGFPRVLTALAQVWRERREEALETAASAMAAIEQHESFPGRDSKQEPVLTLALVDKIAASALRRFDPRNGGFGAQPKFPYPAVLDLLLEAAMNRGSEEAGRAFTLTLEKMARGGIYDHLAGGFHRYSVDDRWSVPHFEKMLYDNTELLRNYVNGFQSFHRQDFLLTATQIVNWMETALSDREHGGFYASQDADVGLDDDGNYFTWTLAEARQALHEAGLLPHEQELALRYFGIRERGDMSHDPARNVLHVNDTVGELAAETGQSIDQLRLLLDSARSVLLAARGRRPTPFIDRTLYTSWNAMAITAFLEAARILRITSARDFAVRTLDRLLNEAWDGDQALGHVIAYAAPPAEGTSPPEKVPGALDDYAFTIHACIDAWLATGKMSFYHVAVKLADAMIARFYDRNTGAFYDTVAPAAGGSALGALAARRKPLQDSPTPAGNPTAAAALLRLEILSGRKEFREIAEYALGFFAGIVERFGLHAASYGLALERLLLDPVQVVIVGSGPEAGAPSDRSSSLGWKAGAPSDRSSSLGSEADRLEELALSRFAVNKTVMRINPSQLVKRGLPEALAEILLHVPPPAAAPAWALVCRHRTCLPPITSLENLREALEQDGQAKGISGGNSEKMPK